MTGHTTRSLGLARAKALLGVKPRWRKRGKQPLSRKEATHQGPLNFSDKFRQHCAKLHLSSPGHTKAPGHKKVRAPRPGSGKGASIGASKTKKKRRSSGSGSGPKLSSTARASWRLGGFRGCRVGEALNPGPSSNKLRNFLLGSQHSSRPQLMTSTMTALLLATLCRQNRLPPQFPGAEVPGQLSPGKCGKKNCC